MGALADSKQGCMLTMIHGDRILRKYAACINDNLCLQIEDGAIFAILRMDADCFSVALQQACCFNIVDGGSAQVLKSAQQRDGVAGIVKLAIMIEDSAAEAIADKSGQLLKCGFRGERISERPNDSLPESSS